MYACNIVRFFIKNETFLDSSSIYGIGIADSKYLYSRIGSLDIWYCIMGIVFICTKYAIRRRIAEFYSRRVKNVSD
jgi:hypothetical protein